MNRSAAISALKNNPQIPVLIVGAGINGIATFRDLALNGVNALLIDRGDFCSGASAASSHMAHGGIRYLENGEFRLVREAVQERNRMIQNAPHFVKPLPTTIPIFKRFSGILNAPLKFMGWLNKPSERGALIIKLGLLMYDAYTGKRRAVPRHRFYSRDEALTIWRELNPKIVNAALYYDGLIADPERLALELLLDAEADNADARALNYVSLMGGERNTTTLRDELTGEIFTVQPKLLINASGAWIDFANRQLGLTTKFIGGTKGSHIVVDNAELREAIGESEFFFENKDGRIVLILPLADRVLIGTSDLKIENPDEADCTEEEINYFLEMIAHVFPKIKVKRDQIVFSFSGVRPLPASSAKTTGQVSRDHHIEVLDGEWTNLTFPIYALIGGKWTSFRAFAQQVADKSMRYLGIKRQKDTRDLAIGGGRNYPRSAAEREKYVNGLAAWTGLPKERLEILFERYGTRAEAVADFIALAEDAPLASLPTYSRREILFWIQREKAQRLDDLFFRRSMLAMLGKWNDGAVVECAALMADALRWDAERQNAETERVLRMVESARCLREKNPNFK
ncbi:MAG: glycerol-3-phosphate dehydrogenase/oxidase [Anaerolineales bacterium]|nr:glycerol-3-phosphate dehydrogenase/oxidase [Anaerolineales bacterium]